jgi:hypothetical protein
VPRGSYVPNVRSFVCPSTQNNVSIGNVTSVNWPPTTADTWRILKNLQTKATDKFATNGHSYECFGFFHTYNDTYFTRKTVNTIQSYVLHQYAGTQWETALQGVKPGPSRVFTIMDRLEVHSPYDENAPNPFDGHGLAGDNVVFTDGHAAFVSKNNWTMTYKTSEDDFHSDVGVAQ